MSLGTRFAVRFADCSPYLGLKTHDFDLAEIPPGKEGGSRTDTTARKRSSSSCLAKGEVLTSVAPARWNAATSVVQAFAVQAGDVLGVYTALPGGPRVRNTGDEPLRFLFWRPRGDVGHGGLPRDRRAYGTHPYGKRARFTWPSERAVPYWDGVRPTSANRRARSARGESVVSCGPRRSMTVRAARGGAE